MAMGRRMMHREPRGPQIRVNHRIRVPEVRVVLDDGSMLGVMTTQDALRRAQERGLDLVEVNPKSNPPVCKILDFGKYKYEEKKRAREAKRKQSVVEVKEIKLRPKTDDHDLNVKLRAARRFLESGNKVKVTVRFRGREITHPERAQMQLNWLLEKLEDISHVDQRPTMEARAMSLIVGPKPQILQRLANIKAKALQREQESGPNAQDGGSADQRQSSASSAATPSAQDDDDQDDDDQDDDDQDDDDQDDDDQDDDDK